MTIHNDLSTPYGTALFMMRRGADAGLIVAYLEHEARAAGVDPLDLSQHYSDRWNRSVRQWNRSVRHMNDQFTALGKRVDRSIRNIAALFQALG